MLSRSSVCDSKGNVKCEKEHEIFDIIGDFR